METTIVEKVRALNLPLGQYVVIGSGIMDALGIRAAADVDIAALPELYEALRATGEWEEEVRYEKVFLKKGDIEINPRLNFPGYDTTIAEAIESATVIDGIPFMSLAELKRFKLALGRPKDPADIALIEAYERGQGGKVSE